MRAFDLASTIPWAITEETLREVLRIAAREDLNPEAVAAKLGRPLDNTRVVSVRDGVAVIPITGPIFRRANLFSEISGATSVQVLARDFTTALEDPGIRAIVLEIDSPGGETTGIHELASMIYAARGRKPIVAYADGTVGSAAYWLASAADEIVLDATAVVGSIGVVAVVRDPGAQTTRQIEIVSSQSPNKRVDVTTEKGRAQIQALVDATADIFVADVARNRGVSVETVLEDFGAGGLLMGAAAVAAGMADRLGSFEQVIAELAGRRPAMMTAQRADAVSQTGEDTLMGEAQKDSRFDRFMRWLNGDSTVSLADSGDEIVLAQTLEPATLTATLEPDPEIERLRAELAAERQKSIETQLTAFVEAELTAGRALPAEQEAMAAAYRQAASDDAAFPLESGSRVALLQALYAKRQPHGLTQDAVKEQALTALQPVLETPKAGEDQPMAEARRQQLLGATSLGQAVTPQK